MRFVSPALRIILAPLVFASVLGAQNAAAQSYPPPNPPTLPSMKIGTAALISPSSASTYYGSGTTWTDGLDAITGGTTLTPPEIIAMSRALKGNVDLIYAYVRNNIQVTWMYGLQKGALGTLIDKAGTPFDQADLMVRLLRQAGYTANYVSGTTTLTGAQFTAWTGISDSNGACQMLANGGFPASVNGSSNMVCATGAGSSISTVTMAHIWVQVTISGTSYLFDPSYKPYTINQINLPAAIGLTSGTPLTTATTGTGYSTGTLAGSVPFVNGLNSTALNTLIGTYSQSLLTSLYSQNLQAARIENVVGIPVIVPDTPPAGGWRQTTLPNESVTASATWTGLGIPDQYRTTLGVSGYIWNYENPAGTNPSAGAWQELFILGANNGIVTFFVDQIYGRMLTVNTDYNFGTNVNGRKYSNTVTLELDGVTLTSFTNPQDCFCEQNSWGYPVIATSRGAPSFMTLGVVHPYAACSDGTATIATATGCAGDYMSATITKSVTLITSLTIVDGFGDANGLFAKWSDEKAADTSNPMGTFGCEQGLCGTYYPGGTGDFEREKTAAAWLVQNTQAARLHAAISGSVPQLHHALGFVYGDNFLEPSYPTVLSQQQENPNFTVGDNFNRVDVDSAISLSSRTADPVARRATIQAFAATSAALEGSAGGELASLPDTSSTATRFEWGNAPPGTAGNWDAPLTSSPNAYEDPGNPGPRKFVQYTSLTASNAATLALIEDHPLSYYTTEPIWSGQPIIGETEADFWDAGYSGEVTAYANCASTSSCGTPGNIPFTVTTSQEAFLGPGQRGGAYQKNVGSSYMDAPSRQRGPALVATAYNSSGDPVAIAHDVMGLGPGPGPWGAGSSFPTKGGGGGDEPFQNVTYNPADAADILKSRFVDKSNALGVNLTNGTIGYTAPAKIDVGNGGFPYELTADFEWGAFTDDTHQTPESPIKPHAGWTTNWNNNLAMSGSGLEAMGKSDVRAAVGTIAAFMAEQDIYKASPSTQRDVAAVLTQAWLARQISANVVTVTLGSSSQQFLSLPQGATMPVTGVTWFTPGPGATASLTMSAAPVAFEQQKCAAAPYQLSRGWDYTGSTGTTPVTFTITNAHGDQQNFGTWSTTYTTSDTAACGYAQGFQLNTWTFPQGVTIHLSYGNPWDPNGQGSSTVGFPQITQVYNTFGTSSTAVRTINFNTDSYANFTGFSDTNGRSVTLGFAGGGVIADSITGPATGDVTTYLILPPQYASPTTRPVPFDNLFQIYTADNPYQPNTEYDWDNIGRVTDVMDAEALQVGDRAPYQFYIADGTRGERDDPLGDPWSVVYDVYGHPATYTDENGNITTDVADGRGRVAQTTYPEGDCEVFGFDDFNNVLNYTKVDKASSCNVSAGSSHVLSIAATWDPTWDKPLTIQDAMGNTTHFSYYAAGTTGASMMYQAVRPTVTGGAPTYTFTYDSAGKLTQSADPITSSTSITTNNAYSTDGLENLVSTTVDPSGKDLVTTVGFDAIGNQSWTMDPRQNLGSNGQVVSYLYDNDRRKLETDNHAGALTAALAASSRTIYDVVGRDIEDDTGTVFSGTTVTTWVMNKKTTYTPTSKVASVTDGDSRITSTTYDSADRPNIATDPVLRQSQKTYDAAGNVLQEIHALGTPNQMTYATYTYKTGTSYGVNGGDGEKLSVYDADGPTHVTTYAYDLFNRLLTTTYPDSTSDKETLGYDANSNILTRIDRANQTFNYTYDVLNRKLTEVVPAYGSSPTIPANTITTAYDLGGRVDQVSDTLGNIDALTYDTAGRKHIVTTTIPGLSGALATTYTLDANSNRTTLAWPDGYSATYSFDTLNRMHVVTDSTSATLATYTYDPYSRPTNLGYGNGASIAYTYTPGSDLLTLTDGFVTTTKNSGYTLGYTNAHQLTSEAYSNSNYDFGPPSTTGTASYTAANVLNQYPGVTPLGGTAQSLTYDANANLTFDGVLTYTYNPQNRLMTVYNGTTLVATYAYDGVDRRVTKTVGSTVTNFLDDGEDEIAEYGPTGTVLRRFVPGRAINDPIAYDNCNGATAPNCTGTVTVKFFATDHHGSVVAMSESNGSPAGGTTDSPYIYDAYGNSPSNMTGVPFRYVGMYYDAETGLYYDRARYYSSALGRFLQDDALLYKDDIDLYTYVGNDPTDKTDPSGNSGGCAPNCPPPLTPEQQAAVEKAEKPTQDKIQNVLITAAMIAIQFVPVVDVAADTAEAGTVVTEGGEAAQALATARSAAQDAGETHTGGTASTLITKDGQTFTGLSNRGQADFATNPDVTSTATSASNPSKFAGDCSECGVVSQAKNTGAPTSGGRIATVRVPGGKIVPPCSSCSAVLSKEGITPVPVTPRQ